MMCVQNSKTTVTLTDSDQREKLPKGIVVQIQGERVEASSRKGVRQGCSLSPPLINLYPEEAINKTKEELKNIGFKVQGKTIKMLRVANDISLLATTERELEIA